MRRVFTVTAAVLLLAVAVQFFLAGSGAFDTAGREEAFGPHRTFGYVVFILAIILTVVAAVARVGRRLVGMAGLILVLVAVQAVIAIIAEAIEDSGGTGETIGAWVFGLHAVNALVILMLLGNLLRGARGVADRTSSGSVSQQS